MKKLTSEEFVPTRWVLRGVERDELANHLRWIKKVSGNEMAKKCLYHCYWVGIVPSNKNRW